MELSKLYRKDIGKIGKIADFKHFQKKLAQLF